MIWNFVAILIPLMYYYGSALLLNAGNSLDVSTLIVQLLTIIILIPYFILNKDKYSATKPYLLKSIMLFFLGIGFVVFLRAFVFHYILSVNLIFNPLFFITTIILAPICEEMFFRGFLNDRFSFLGKGACSIITASLFSLGHLITYSASLGLLQLLCLALYNNYLRTRTNNLLPGIMFHSMWNVVSTIIK